MKTESPNAIKLADAIIEAYLATGEAQSVKQLAPRLGWSESKVRKVLDECQGCPNRCIYAQDWVTTYERGYNSQHGAVKVGRYQPTMETLRDMISETSTHSQ